jgi:hypothetical protein
MNWHQANAIKHNRANMHLKAHIIDDKTYGNVALCGKLNPIVTVDTEHHKSPFNNTCKKCAAKLK